MSEKYQQVKNIFSDILETEPLKEISIKNYMVKRDYIKDVYNHVTKENYADMKKDAIQFLGISHSQLDEFFVEIICSNLYCDLSVILQIVGDKRKRHEYFLGELDVVGNEYKTTIERFRKRLQPERINKIEKLKISDDECIYYAPTLIRAYKDTLLIKRDGTDILDISDVFIDIFKALFYDTDEQTKDSSYTKSIRQIKAYRLWEFTPATIQQVANIYQKVFDSSNSYKYAENVFLEKLFGLLTLNEIISKNFGEKELIFITRGMGKMHLLGYSRMTKLIASKICYKNYHIFEDVISSYIYPLCSECIVAILNDVITYIARIESKERASFIEDIRNVCHNNSTKMPNKDLLNNIESDCIMDMFKTLFDLPKDSKDKNEKTKVLRTYLSSLKGSYIYTDIVEGKEITKAVVNDMSYESLFYPQYIPYSDDVFPRIDEELKNCRRINY